MLRDQDTWWRKLFKLRQFETKNRKFAYEITTHGRSAKVLMRRPKVVDTIEKKVLTKLSVTKKGKVRLHLKVQNMPHLDESRFDEVWGVDPGYRSLTTACSSVDGRIIKCTAKEFYRDAQYERSQRLANRWQRKDDVVRTAVQTCPTKHYTTQQGCKKYVQHILPVLDHLLGFYGARRFRNLKLLRHIASKRKLTSICKQLTAKCGRRTLVVMGDFSITANSPIKGHPPGPISRLTKELKAHCTVVEADESYTSKTCNHCKKQAFCNMHSQKLHRDSGELRTQKIHGLLHCTTSGCRSTTIDRDINASRNILDIGLSLMRGQPRPECFFPQVS
eukprot:jgi/Chrzof1/8002/UNPLg00053.t1